MTCRNTVSRAATLAALAFFCCDAQADETAADADPIELGRRVYEEGLSSSGEPVTALVSGDVEISGEYVVCGQCHRRSGLGASEGPSIAPPVVGALLYEPFQLPTSRPPEPPVLRPAYTRETLAKSIRAGVSSNGEEFSMLMPRYPLSDQDMDNLIAYLEWLDVDPDPGVTDSEIHFATIITDDVDPAARKALLDVMDVFVEQKNTETRYESKRADRGPWHKDWMFKPYRKWMIHEWAIEGPEETWNAQLQSLYEQQPVFAILNGVSGRSWAPVHAFCEAEQIPCLFPTTDLPVADREDFYNVYLSRGMTIEARAIAGRLASEDIGFADVVQVYDPDDPRSNASADVLRELSAGEINTLTLSDLRDVKARAVVGWIDADALTGLENVQAQQVYLSGALLAGHEAQVPEGLKQAASIVYSTEIPGQTARLLMRSTGWFRFKRIYSRQHEAIQANAYFALKMAGGVLAKIRGFFERDYFIETIEHMVDNATYTSVYPHMSLAPEQRFVSKGVRIAHFDEAGQLVADDTWLVPDAAQ